jgi:hypothetical protein
MFTTEQIISQKPKNTSNEAFSAFGTTLAKHRIVKSLDIHKIITLAVGIFVAIVIALTLWIKAPADAVTSLNSAVVPQLPFEPFHKLIETAVKIIP